MNWILIGLLTALTAAAQTPAETAQTLNAQGNRAEESGNYPELADALQSLGEVREKEHLFDEAARLNTRAQMIRGYR